MPGRDVPTGAQLWPGDAGVLAAGAGGPRPPLDVVRPGGWPAVWVFVRDQRDPSRRWRTGPKVDRQPGTGPPLGVPAHEPTLQSQVPDGDNLPVGELARVVTGVWWGLGGPGY